MAKCCIKIIHSADELVSGPGDGGGGDDDAVVDVLGVGGVGAAL